MKQKMPENQKFCKCYNKFSPHFLFCTIIVHTGISYILYSAAKWISNIQTHQTYTHINIFVHVKVCFETTEPDLERTRLCRYEKIKNTNKNNEDMKYSEASSMYITLC